MPECREAKIGQRQCKKVRAQSRGKHEAQLLFFHYISFGQFCIKQCKHVLESRRYSYDSKNCNFADVMKNKSRTHHNRGRENYHPAETVAAI